MAGKTINTLEVLNGSGHISLTWDHTNQAEVEATRAEVERLRQAGYSFFLVTGEPADAVRAGAGELIVKRIDDPLRVHEEAAGADVAGEPPERPVAAPKRRGRRKTTANGAEPASELVEGAKAVAIRPQRGG